MNRAIGRDDGEHGLAGVEQWLAELPVRTFESGLSRPVEYVLNTGLGQVRDLQIGECRARVHVDLWALRDESAVCIECDGRVEAQRLPRREHAAFLLDLDEGECRIGRRRRSR